MKEEDAVKAFGHENGEVLTDAEGNQEKVVFDYDEKEKNQVVGWHKEPVKGKRG